MFHLYQNGYNWKTKALRSVPVQIKKRLQKTVMDLRASVLFRDGVEFKQGLRKRFLPPYVLVVHHYRMP